MTCMARTDVAAANEAMSEVLMVTDPSTGSVTDMPSSTPDLEN